MQTEVKAQIESIRRSEYCCSVDEVGEEEWSQILSLFEDASIYQTWAYGAVSWGERQLSHLVLRRGVQIVAAAQVRVVRAPLLPLGVAYIRWGPLWRRSGTAADTENLAAVIRAIIEVYSERRGLMLRVVPNLFCDDPLAHEIAEIWSSQGFPAACTSEAYHTIRVDLTPPPEEMRKRLDQKWRNQLNGAERNGLRIVSGTGQELFERFLGIYDEMMERKRFETSVDPRDFVAIQLRLPQDQKMVVMLAENNGESMAGVIGAAIGTMGVYLLGATTQSGMKSKGSYLLQWRMMQHFRETGCRWYDLGGINAAGNPGVYHFKSGMGGTETHQLGCYEYRARWTSFACVRASEKLIAMLGYVRNSVREHLPLAARATRSLSSVNRAR